MARVALAESPAWEDQAPAAAREKCRSKQKHLSSWRTACKDRALRLVSEERSARPGVLTQQGAGSLVRSEWTTTKSVRIWLKYQIRTKGSAHQRRVSHPSFHRHSDRRLRKPGPSGLLLDDFMTSVDPRVRCEGSSSSSRLPAPGAGELLEPCWGGAVAGVHSLTRRLPSCIRMRRAEWRSRWAPTSWIWGGL
jgi:hypothetical protein